MAAPKCAQDARGFLPREFPWRWTSDFGALGRLFAFGGTQPEQDSTRKRVLNPGPAAGKIKAETLRPTLFIILAMMPILKSAGDRVRVALTLALLAACSLNVMFLCARF